MFPSTCRHCSISSLVNFRILGFGGLAVSICSALRSTSGVGFTGSSDLLGSPFLKPTVEFGEMVVVKLNSLTDGIVGSDTERLGFGVPGAEAASLCVVEVRDSINDLSLHLFC